MLARGWTKRSVQQCQNSTLYQWHLHGITLELTSWDQSPHCHAMAIVSSWQWATTLQSGSKQLLYLQSVHKEWLNHFSRYDIQCDVIYCYFQVVFNKFKYIHIGKLITFADLHVHGFATRLDNWPREGISQPAQWGTHEESRNQASPHHSIPSTGNLYFFPSYNS